MQFEHMRRVALLSVAAFGLAGCIYGVERASIAVADNDRIDANLVIHNRVEANGLLPSLPPDQRTQEQRDQAAARQRDELEQLRNCLDGSVSFAERPFQLRIAVRNQTAEQLQEALTCLPGSPTAGPSLNRFVEVSLDTEDGFFRTRRMLTMILRFPVLRENSGEVHVPQEIKLEMRGLNARVNQGSELFDTIIERETANSINVRFIPRTSVARMWWQQQTRMDCFGQHREDPNRTPCPNAQPYVGEVEIVAETTTNKFGLGDILAFFSILFGSGIAVTLGSRVLAVRTENRNKGGS